MLDDSDPLIRALGAKLARCSDAELVPRLLEFLQLEQAAQARYEAMLSVARLGKGLEDVRERLISLVSDRDLRSAAITELSFFAGGDPRAAEAILSACQAPDVRFRRDAVFAAGNIATRFPAAAAELLRAVDDEDPGVREAAVGMLPNAGREGVRVALRLLLEQRELDRHGEQLADLVVEGGLLREALDRRPSGKPLSLLLRAVCANFDREPDLVRPMRGRSRSLIEAFEPDQNHGYSEFFRAVSVAGDGSLLPEVVVSCRRSERMRTGALLAHATFRRLHPETLALARRILEDPASPRTLRHRVISRFLDEDFVRPGLKEGLVALFREHLGQHPSPALSKLVEEAAR